jgi:hypothetical protein
VMGHLLYADWMTCALMQEAVMDFMIDNTDHDAPGSLIKGFFAAFARAEKNAVKLMEAVNVYSIEYTPANCS